jgi:hypothetical protein
MARIERREFIEQLSRSGPIGVDQVAPALEQSGISRTELAGLAGGDHVLNDPQELANLYDRLAELDRTSPLADRPPRLDTANRLYATLLEHAVPSSDGAPAQGGVGIGRAPRRGALIDEAAGPAVPASANSTTASPQGASPGPAVAADPAATDPAAAPRLIAVGEQRIGSGRQARIVEAFVALTPAVEAEVTRLAGLPAAPGVGRNAALPGAGSYLEAIDAYEAHLARGPAGARDARGGRPVGVNMDQWNQARALHLQGISGADVRHYLATGQLPDLVDAQGQTLMSGADRMARLDRNARQQGEWTAVNSFTFLMTMQRSALLAEAQGMRAEITAMPADHVGRPALTRRAEETTQLAEQVRLEQHRIYLDASHSRERIGRSEVARADGLTRQANGLRSSDPTRAAALDTEAQTLRDRGTQRLHKEAQYRESVPRAGLSASRAYQGAAEGQIANARAEIVRADAAHALPEAVPVALSAAPTDVAANGVPGAGVLLDRSRALDPAMARDQTQLRLEGDRLDVEAGFHQAHLRSGNYQAHVRANTAPAALIAHRRAYLEARVDQVGIADERLALYGPPGSVPAADALEAARVAGQRQEILGEFTADLAASQGADRGLVQARERVNAAEQAVTATNDAVTAANTEVNEAREERTRTNEAADALLGDTLKSGGEVRRDNQSVRDAAAIVQGAEASQTFALARSIDADAAALEARAAYGRADRLAQGQGADAALVARALAVRTPGHSTDVATAYRSTFADADAAASARTGYLDRAEATLPRDPTLRDAARREIGAGRLDTARYYSNSAELRVYAEGDAGRLTQGSNLGGVDRLNRADRAIDQANTALPAFPPGSPEATAYGGLLVDSYAGLAERWADYRPAASQAHLVRGETLARTQLPAGPDRQAALERVGQGAVVSLARHQSRFAEVYGAGQYVPGTEDAMYAQARRILGGPRTFSTEAGRQGAELLGHFDVALAAVPNMVAAAQSQVQAGQNAGAGRIGALGRAEAQVVNSQISSVISGPVWLLSGGHLDMHEEVAGVATGMADSRISTAQDSVNRFVGGGTDFVAAYQNARDQGRTFEFLGATRILGDETLRNLQPNGTQRAAALIDTFAPPGSDGRWQSFFVGGIRGTPGMNPDDPSQRIAVPVTRALAGPVLGFSDSLRSYGQRDLPVMIDATHGAVRNAADSYQQQKDDVGYTGYAVIGLEVALGVVATGGLGSGAALARAGAGARTAVGAVEAAQAASALANVGRAVGHTLLAGGVLVGASWGVRRLAGANTSFARGFDTVTNFIPAGVAQRASNMGRAVVAAEQGGSHLAAMSAAGRRALAQSTPAMIAFSQGFLTSLGTAEGAQRLGIRSEFGQAMFGLGLNALFAGGMAYGTTRYTQARYADAMSRSLVESVPGGVDPAAARAVRGEVGEFLRSIGDRVPTESQMSAFRSRLYEHLGAQGTDAGALQQRRGIDGFVETFRIERSAARGMAEARRGLRGEAPLDQGRTQQAVEHTAEALLASRGEGSSRAQAYRDAATFFEARYRTEAEAIRGTDPSRAEQLDRQADWARDRAIAADVTGGLSRNGAEGQAPILNREQAGRAEGVIADELTRPGETQSLRTRAQDPHFVDGLTERLVHEGDLSPELARTVAEATRQDLVERGLIPADSESGHPVDASPYGRRETVGWSGTPTASPAPGQEHLGVIHQGIERMPTETRAQLDTLLTRAENGDPALVAEQGRLAERQAALYERQGRIYRLPEAQRAGERQVIDTELAQVEAARTDVDQRLEADKAAARNQAIQVMGRFRSSIQGDSASARGRANDLRVADSADAHGTNARHWAANFLRLVGPALDPSRIEVVQTDRRANAAPSGQLNLGARPSETTTFHELGHYLEYQNPQLRQAALAWRDARGQHANGRVEVAPLQQLRPDAGYGPGERAVEDHFVSAYVGKTYAEGHSEVLSMGLERFTNARDMLRLYQQDPEHFFFTLGALPR